MDKLISDILELPDKVRKGDFVLNLSKGVNEPGKTLEQYVVTPQLVASFDDALGFIRSAVDASNSKACYLHGSFGSGKSHFMAVLHLLLQHNSEVRSIPELASVCDKNQWVEDKKFLLVPYHMIGSRSMESAILGGYVDYVQDQHAGAPLPGVYLADEIFENAKQLRERLGDEKFFEDLNKGGSGGGGGWGKLEGWNAERFDAAIEAPPKSKERSQLVGKLVENIFTAFRGIAQGKDEAYVDLDEGLAIISEHAKTLGYDGLILFLDELILWLATHSADLNFVQTEGNKLAKLVESRKAERPVPIISFVARQRDLRDLIGENVTGVESLNFSDVLSHWEGRFHTIALEDRNLPVIAQKRVLKPKDDACKAELEQAFEQTAKVRQEIMEVLLTREADRAMFKQVYPFSPALIQALVAVSSALQRERTALKIMLQLLVNRRDTLRLGDVIPLGDLWDVVAHGDEAFTDVMRVRFENAKKLYQNKLRPMLEQQHEIDFEVDKQRAKENEEIADRLARFENDDRLVKSMLLSSLVQGVDALKNMTCTRLAALNHGTIRSRIPGREHQVVAQKLRTWAGICGELRVEGDPANPTVSLELEGVDTESLIEAARVFDNPGNRQSRIRGMLFQSLGIPDQDEMFIGHNFVWRGSRRSCDVLFSNVRALPDESLRSSDEWKLILDFPFDSEGHTPIEDLDRLNQFRDKNEAHRTIVWLPSFFSTRTQGELGKLVIIDHLLRGSNLDQYAKHLSMQDRETARLLLKNQQSALQSRINQVVEAAYAIRSEPTPGSLDSAYDMSESHFQSLFPSLMLQRPVGANLGEALEHLLDQALSHQYPKHPKFGQEIKLGKDLKQVLAACQEAARTQDGRIIVDDKSVRPKLRNICNPLDLGQMHETPFVLGTFWKTHFNRMLAQSGQPHPTVADLRRWMDQPDERGLPREIQNLLVLVYADQTNRSFVRYGGNCSPTLDDMPNELELVEQQLPDVKDWETAVQRVSEVFGLAISRLLNASNLTMLASKVEESVGDLKSDCDMLPDRLQLILKNLGIAEIEIGKADRVRTAKAVRKLLEDCEGKEATALVGAIASASVETSGTAMGRSFKSATSVLDCLRNTKWDLFEGVSHLADERKTQADMLIQDVQSALCTDELALAGGLASKLSEAESRAVKLLTPPKPKPDDPPPPPPPKQGWKQVGTGSRSRLSHDESLEEAQGLIQKLEQNDKLRLTIHWTLEEESE
ncbi:Bacteriophage resistance protein PglY [Planctomycetales bacterium 10988]|nr:Bacteriophage resistance protein PglY [Planctomycetales bacterium 10988]